MPYVFSSGFSEKSRGFRDFGGIFPGGFFEIFLLLSKRKQMEAKEAEQEQEQVQEQVQVHDSLRGRQNRRFRMCFLRGERAPPSCSAASMPERERKCCNGTQRTEYSGVAGSGKKDQRNVCRHYEKSDNILPKCRKGQMTKNGNVSNFLQGKSPCFPMFFRKPAEKTTVSGIM